LRTRALPFQPLRQHLYTASELFDGFDAADPASWGRTPDFRIYQAHIAAAAEPIPAPYISMMQALHDHAISQAVADLTHGRKVAAIMGGHKLPRDADAYRHIAHIARRLTRHGVLMCSGGGPGAMEATHLGAAFASAPDRDLDAALHALAQAPTVPELSGIVTPSGDPNPDLLPLAAAWFAPAIALARALPAPQAAPPSLAIPTWHYGHEPTSPFATHIAKYFQNSIREDGLLAIAYQGVIYAQGRAGTIQEIFQDANQNYYRSFKHFSPMVLLDRDYWTTNYPVAPLLERLFGPEDFKQYVLLTDDPDEAARFIEAFVPPPDAR
jgi:predicted Rossmann-fold nucleotide-binding protein